MSSSASDVSTSPVPKGGLHLGLWVVQSLLAFAFLLSGSMKLTTPYDTLSTQMAWAKQFAPLTLQLIGAVEVAGALGLILPSALRILPFLTPLAAGGLVLTMLGAAATHLSINEPQMIVPNIVLGSLSAFVAWGRFRKAPIAARS